MDPEDEIATKLQDYLFSYSHLLQGVPLTYELVGIIPMGKICGETGAIFLEALARFLILSFNIGNVLTCVDGFLMGVFSVIIDKDEEYTGNFKVVNINSYKYSFVIHGTAV